MNQSKDKQLDIEILRDKRISMALMGPYVVLTIQYLILVYMNLLGTSMERNIQLLSKLLVAILFAHTLPAVFDRNKVRLIRTYSAWVFIFLLHYLVFPETRPYQKELVFPFFFMCLPAFIYSSAVRDWNILRGVMAKASHVIFYFGVLLGFLIISGRASAGAYSMTLGYYLLWPAVVFVDEVFDRASFKSIIFASISFLLILVLGSRGPVMCIGVFILLRLLRPPRRLGYAHIIMCLVIATSAILIALFSNELLMYIQGSMSQFGIGSRSISLFLRPNVHLSGRDLLYRKVIARIIDYPFAGIGIAGDRHILGGLYVHNIFLEILANYGIIIGMIVILGLIILQLRCWFCKGMKKYEMFAMWFSVGFIPLLVSGSYLAKIEFWTFIGLMTSGLHFESNVGNEVGKD